MPPVTFDDIPVSTRSSKDPITFDDVPMKNRSWLDIIKSAAPKRGLFGTSLGKDSDILQKARIPSEMVQGISNAMMDAYDPQTQSVALNEALRTPETVASIIGQNVANTITPENAIMQIALGLTKAIPMQSALENLAQTRGAKALGYTKKFLKTPQDLAEAKNVAQTMMDQGVLGPVTSAEEMANRAQNVAAKSGSAIGKYLQNAGTGFDPNSAIAEIESIRPQFKGGYYDAINNTLDEAIATIKAHGSGPLSFEEVNKLKGLLQDAAKFNSNSNAIGIGTARMAAGKFRANLDQQLENLAKNKTILQTEPMIGTGSEAIPSGGAFTTIAPNEGERRFQEFLQNKKVYGASQQALDALGNRLGSEVGNNVLSLPTVIAAGSELAAGNPGRALGLAGFFGAAKRYGDQTTALLANKLAQVPSLPPSSYPLFATGGLGLASYLNRNPQ